MFLPVGNAASYPSHHLTWGYTRTQLVDTVLPYNVNFIARQVFTCFTLSHTAKAEAIRITYYFGSRDLWQMCVSSCPIEFVLPRTEW